MSLDDHRPTPDQIRHSLNDIPSSMLSDATIEQYIDEEKVVVRNELDEDWEDDPEIDPEVVGLLWRRRATREAFHSSPVEVRRAALDATVSTDIQAFRGRLNRQVDKAYELLGKPRGGDRAAFADSSGSVFDRQKPSDP